MQEVVVTFEGPAMSPPFAEMPAASVVTHVAAIPDSTMGEVIDQAARSAGIELDYRAVREFGLSQSVAANLGGIELAGAKVPGAQQTFDVFGKDGELWWGQLFNEVTLRQLVQSTERGITTGDPFTWHVRVCPPGSGFDPGELLEAAKNLGELYAALTVIKGGSETLQWYADRLRAGWNFIKRHDDNLTARGATLHRLQEAAAALERLDDLATALGVPREEAAELVALWGYEPQGSAWHFTGTQGQTMRMITDLSWQLPHNTLQSAGSSTVTPAEWADALDKVLTQARDE